MANPEHVELVWKGSRYVNEWREKHPNETLDLSGAKLGFVNLRYANLSGCILERADLSNAFLVGANLQKSNLKNASLINATLLEADLSEADLSKANLGFANLAKSNLSKSIFKEARLAVSWLGDANLSEANFYGARLFETNLTHTNLSLTKFSGADLRFSKIIMPKKLLGTDFSGADLSYAILDNLDLSNVKIADASMKYTVLVNCILVSGVGLDSVKHTGPSHIDFQTLLFSFMLYGEFPADVEVFLLNAGVPKSLLDAFPDIVAKTDFYSCFVCYGEPDKEFAEKLVRKLRRFGVPCWVYSMDYTPGERLWREINKQRKSADKMVVLCSAKSLVRDGVLKEIEEQIDEDPEKIIPISLDDTWKEPGFQVKRGGRDLKPFLLDKNYADFSDETRYQDSLRRLLKALKKSQKQI